MIFFLKEKLPNLSLKDIDAFLGITTYHNLNNEIVLDIDDKSKKAFLILKGTVRGYIVSNDGIEKNIMIRSEGIFIADVRRLFNDEPQKFTFKSIGEVHILLFNYNDFETLANNNLNIMQLYLNILKEAVVRLMYRVESLTTMTNEESYLDIIKLNPNFLKKIYSKHLANYLGITNVSLSRIMKRIKNKS